MFSYHNTFRVPIFAAPDHSRAYASAHMNVRSVAQTEKDIEAQKERAKEMRKLRRQQKAAQSADGEDRN